MTIALAFLIFVVLIIVSVFHVYWAFGGKWPGHDEISLARAVVGSQGITAMPGRGPTLAVALLIFCAGVVALMQADVVPALLPPMMRSVAVVFLAALFLVRGIVSFTPQFRRSQSEEPFATLDRRLYGPLCLALGAGFAVLAI